MFVANAELYVPNPYGVSPATQDGEMLSMFGHRFEKGLRRPYLDKNERLAVTVNTGRWTTEKGVRVPIREHRYVADLINNGTMLPFVTNATALRKEEWLLLDREVLRAARFRLQAWSDLIAANSFGGFNGMGKMILEHETMSDPGEAMVDMDALSEGRRDAPTYQLEGLPLPITHSDFWFDSRRLTISRNTGTPLDTTMAEAGSRRIAETLERTTIGNQTGVTYGGNSTQVGGYGRTSSVYGYLNFSNRLTSTFAGRKPTTAGWTAAYTLADVLTCLNTLKANKFYGPFMVYHSNDWDPYLDNDYILTGGNVATQTLRQRLQAIRGISDVVRLDMLFSSIGETNSASSSYKGPGYENVAAAYPFTMIFVSMQKETARAVNGMDMTTLQWETKGGMQLNFKIMCIQVPQVRADRYGNCGVLQATFT